MAKSADPQKLSVAVIHHSVGLYGKINNKAVLSQRNSAMPLQIAIDTECAGSCLFCFILLSPIHTAGADATKLFCRVASASAVCT